MNNIVNTMNQDLMNLAQQAREKKGAIKMTDPIQAEKMKQAMQQSMNQMTGLGQDISHLPPEMRRQILKQRVRQRQYLTGMQRANMHMREVEAEKMEERMKQTMTNMPQQMAAMRNMQNSQVSEESSADESEEEMTEEEKERRRKKNQKKRDRKKKNAALKKEEKNENNN